MTMATTAPSQMPVNDYTRYWRRQKMLRILYVAAVFGSFAAYFPAIYLVMMASQGKFDPWPYILGGLAVPVLAPLPLLIKLANFRCPRCGNRFSDPRRFFEKRTLFNERSACYDKYLAPLCVHCGLPRFAISGAEIICPLFCSKCGSGLGKSARFCAKCGAQAPPESPGMPDMPPPLPSSLSERQSRP